LTIPNHRPVSLESSYTDRQKPGTYIGYKTGKENKKKRKGDHAIHLLYLICTWEERRKRLAENEEGKKKVLGKRSARRKERRRMHKMFRFVQLILFVASEDRSDLFLSFCRDLYDVLLILGAFFFLQFYSICYTPFFWKCLYL
jgi:hypothetical protein